jgi:hypothetical protein
MRSAAGLVAVIVGLLLLASPAGALVLCAKKRGGVVRLREACTRKETAVPLEPIIGQSILNGVPVRLGAPRPAA